MAVLAPPAALRPSLRHGWLVPLALLCQVAAVYVAPSAGEAPLRRAGLAAAYAVLLLVVWLNRRWWGVRVLAVGLLLNVVALVIGRGLMPVAPETLRAAGRAEVVQGVPPGSPVPHSKDVLMARSGTPLWPLVDSIPVNRGAVHYAMSPGDVVILLGMAIGMAEAVIALSAPRGAAGVEAGVGRAVARG